MILLFVTALTGTILYLALLRYYDSWWKTPVVNPLLKHTQPFISVVIAARNESGQIDQCLQSVLTQSYPADSYEIIVVDDQSEDETFTRISSYDRVLALQTDGQKSGKKHALTRGIETARGEIIVMTDADCMVPESWLDSFAQTFDAHVQLVTGPVLYHSAETSFQRFQALDVLSLAWVTAAGIESKTHFLSNGANMAFRLTAFHAVGGFDTGHQFASGDDLFLTQAISIKYPDGIKYLWGPAAAVKTPACNTVGEFIEQRVRWASKNNALPQRAVHLTWIGIWLIFTLNLIALITSIWTSVIGIVIALSLIGIILFAEYRVLRRIASYYKQKHMLDGYIRSGLIHYAYVILMGLITPFRKSYRWKGRRVN